MTIERLRTQQENKGLTRQLGIKLAKGILAITGVKDPELKPVSPVKVESSKVYPKISLEAEWTR